VKTSVTATCAGCGVQKEIPSQYRLGDWRLFSVILEPNSRKYDTLLACVDCRPRFEAAVKERDEAYQIALKPFRAAYSEAQRYQANWDMVNPRPKTPSYLTRVCWARRTVCGCCGLIDEREVELAKTPGPIDWPRLLGKHGGPQVCPSCFDRPDHAALRQALEDLAERRNAQVGGHFRKAEELRPSWTYPKLSAGWRMTARIKRWFGL
jgi:hypothetical protein